MKILVDRLVFIIDLFLQKNYKLIYKVLKFINKQSLLLLVKIYIDTFELKG